MHSSRWLCVAEVQCHTAGEDVSEECRPSRGFGKLLTPGPTGSHRWQADCRPIRGLKREVRKRRIPRGLTPRLGCVPLCSLRFLLFSATCTNRVPATGIVDPSQKENRVGSVNVNQKHERVIGPEHGGPRVQGGLPSARPSRPLVPRVCTEARLNAQIRSQTPRPQ
jgi:hypothetical protein